MFQPIQLLLQFQDSGGVVAGDSAVTLRSLSPCLLPLSLHHQVVATPIGVIYAFAKSAVTLFAMMPHEDRLPKGDGRGHLPGAGKRLRGFLCSLSGTLHQAQVARMNSPGVTHHLAIARAAKHVFLVTIAVLTYLLANLAVSHSAPPVCPRRTSSAFAVGCSGTQAASVKGRLSGSGWRSNISTNAQCEASAFACRGVNSPRSSSSR